MFEIITASFFTALVTGLITFWVQEYKLKAELRTEFMAEKAAKKLLESDKWKRRSFAEIQKRLGGFADDELRKLLVRAGAVRFTSSNEEELWGLIERNVADV
jgi:hypothetical protein